ncbi:hypothetical protein CES85_4927 [Ochrobactrum quorumnocens]|uniref:Uncharacterized protein n=1 Tax=Ochrobactrum quorumnocens TaxID=271865 RepID=A0A248UBM9_9HYPH|nr:hypothetical protein CES85_4927 [[Ochrobactrum] quorumnocens]
MVLREANAIRQTVTAVPTIQSEPEPLQLFSKYKTPLIERSLGFS